MNRPNFTIIQNPNKEEFNTVSEAIRANGNYCCCAVEKTADTMCLCKEFRESQEVGFCHCHRFYKVRNSETLGLLVDITDDGFVTKFYDKLCSKVDHPAHYNQGTIECIDAMVAAYGKEVVKYFCLCNTFKYIWRANNKNGIEDIDKAIWYLHKYKELSVNE